jgi:hypothetical protein
MSYSLHLRITSVTSPRSGQPHAGGADAGDVLVDQVIDLRDWVAERLAIDAVEPATLPEPAPVVEPVKPAESPMLAFGTNASGTSTVPVKTEAPAMTTTSVTSPKQETVVETKDDEPSWRSN